MHFFDATNFSLIYEVTKKLTLVNESTNHQINTLNNMLSGTIDSTKMHLEE